MGIIFCLAMLFLIWLLLTEFSYLPAWMNRAVYQWTASSYERKWKKSAYSIARFEELVIAHIKPALANNREAVLLDLACGTGRLARYVIAQDWFSGRIVCVDSSSAMLAHLENGLKASPELTRTRVTFEQRDLRTDISRLPKADVIGLLEASEFLPGFPGILGKLCTQLKPHGILVMTKPPDYLGRLFFGRCQTLSSLSRLLERLGMTVKHRQKWRWRFEIIIVQKITCLE